MLTMAGLLTGLRGGWLLPAVLSTTAGAVDVIGFLALGGRFTAHITGNLVILATHYAIGCFGEIGPLLSVPVFVAVLGVVTLASVEAEVKLALPGAPSTAVMTTNTTSWFRCIRIQGHPLCNASVAGCQCGGAAPWLRLEKKLSSWQEIGRSRLLSCPQQPLPAVAAFRATGRPPAP